MTQERAVLAGGCFWGMQDLIRRHDGVISTRVGYSGGDVPNATYRRLRHSRARRTTSTAASSSAYRAGHGTGTLFPSGFRLVRNFSELQAPPGPFHRQQCIPFALDRHTLADLVHARPPLRKLLSIAETKLSGKAKARIGRGRSRVDKVRTNPPV